MSDTSNDEQDRAEALDSDQFGTSDDPDIEPSNPPDAPRGVEEYGLTAAEEQVGEPLEVRVAREEPDPLVAELDGAAPVRQDPTADPDLAAEEAALHLDPEAPPDGPTGRPPDGSDA